MLPNLTAFQSGRQYHASSWSAVMQQSVITVLDPPSTPLTIPPRPANPGSKTAIIIAALQNLPDPSPGSCPTGA